MSQDFSRRSADIPPEITFVSLPSALSQFHHLPSHVPIWTHQQEQVEKKGYDFQEGVEVMEKLLKAAPNAPGAYLYQLFVGKWKKLMELNPYFKSGRIAEVIPKLVEILQIDPECPLTCFQLGFCFRATGELEKSESFYKQALRMAPETGWIYSNLGRTYQAMGDKVKSAETFWKALELLPGDHFVLEQLMGLGELFLLPSQDKAGGEVRFIRRIDYEKTQNDFIRQEKNPDNLIKRGWVLLRDGLNETACRCFEKAFSENPELKEALLGQGTAHVEAGRYKVAERFLEEYLDETPGSVAAHLNLFKAYLAQEEMDLAWDEIRTAVQLDPQRLESLRQLYYLFRETDRIEEGLVCLGDLTVDFPNAFAPPLVKAQAHSELDQWPEAEELLREALQRAPHQEDTLLFYTAELGKRGKQKELIQLLENEKGALPLSLTLNLALAYRQNNQMEKGKGILKEFLGRPGLEPEELERVALILKNFETGS